MDFKIFEKKFRGLSIYQKSFCAFVLASCFFTGISGIAYYVHAKRVVTDSIQSQASLMSSLATHEFSANYSAVVHQNLNLLKTSTQLNNYLMSSKEERLFCRAETEKMFLSLMQNRKDYLSTTFLNAAGLEKIAVCENKRRRNYRLLAEVAGDDILGQNMKKLFMSLKSDKTITSASVGPFCDKYNRWGFLAGIVIQEPEAGGFGGVIIQHYDIADYILGISQNQILNTPVVWVYGRDGKILHSPPDGQARQDPGQFPSKEKEISYFGVSVVKCVLFADEPPVITVVCSVPPEVISRELLPIVWFTVLFFCVLLAVSLLCSFIVSRWVSNPIKKLTKAVKNISLGELAIEKFPKAKDARDEIGVLADAFNKMREDLSVSINKIKEENLQRKQAEKRLASANKDLELRNEALDKARQESIQLMKDAKAANEAKSEFLANMSHEIRTPMNAVIGFCDLLMEEGLNDTQIRYNEMIRAGGNNLLELINDILDFSKIEAGQLDIEIIDCSLGDILNSVGSLTKAKAVRKGLKFEIAESNGLPAQIRTDPTRLQQCLINLVGNAVKFTDQGHVFVNVSLHEHEDKPAIRFDIEDTGIGIAADKQSVIFESFSQADGSYTRRYGGTGLGLTITKQLAGLLGGELTLTSQEGKGSVFSLTIPAGVDVVKQPLLDRQNIGGMLESEHDKSAHDKFSGHVLVAEDVKTNQMVIRIMLENIGLEVTIAGDGKEAVQYAQEKSFDLIFMDIHMSGMSGYDTTKAIRKEGITTPIVALTANAIKGDDEKCLKAGCDDYMSKPIDQARLSEILQKYLPVEAAA